MKDEKLKVLRAMAPNTRYRILQTLIDATEMSVELIAEHLNMTHSAISHQLAVLLGADIVQAQKIGRNMLYQIAKTPAGTMAKKIMRV